MWQWKCSRPEKYHSSGAGLLRITFEELCGNGTGTVPPLGAADYMALAAAFHTIFISNVPQLSQLLRDETRRLITAIDGVTIGKAAWHARAHAHR